MIDPKILKEKPQTVKEMLERRRINFPLDELVNLDKRRREIIIEIQELKRQRNVLTEAIAKKKKAKEDADRELGEMKQIGQQIDTIEKEDANVESRFRQLMMSLPNILDGSVPTGESEKNNVVVRKGGSNIKEFSFKPRDHVDIATSLGLVDLERAAKISGARFYFLINDLVRLDHALVQFAFDFLAGKGYNLVQPPFMIRKAPMEGAVILDDFQDVIYKIEGEDLFMIGTSEHAIAGMHMDEILDGKNLPIRYAGFSPCFRKEAGAHGKDMKGIFRVHQFEKVEQFVYTRPEESWNEHERMLSITEEFYDKLGIPYRTLLLCSADIGKISSKTYDIEAWMPGQNAYREIVSCSNCLDYQARRLAIRFRDKTNEDTRLVHTLNSTLVATERTMVAILENCQTSSGSVEIPSPLQKYMGDTKEIKPSQ